MWIIIFQDRFFISSSVSQTDQLWHIPITFTTGNNPDWETLTPLKVMSERTDTVERSGTGHEWVIFNVQQKGLFKQLRIKSQKYDFFKSENLRPSLGWFYFICSKTRYDFYYCTIKCYTIFSHWQVIYFSVLIFPTSDCKKNVLIDTTFFILFYL